MLLSKDNDKNSLEVTFLSLFPIDIIIQTLTNTTKSEYMLTNGINAKYEPIMQNAYSDLKN
jgi:hypothetical protein